MVAFIAIVVFMVRSTLNGADQKRNLTSVFQKILLNHIQLIMLTSSFDFNWPDKIKKIFDTSAPVSEATT